MARIRMYGPEPINIFMRLREEAGLTYSELSRASHIDEKALARSEHGIYSNPLPSLSEFWVRQGKASVPEINEDYDYYIQRQRERHPRYFGDLDVDPNDLSTHPFIQLRNKRPHLDTMEPLPVGPTECARALCVPLDTIQFFERRYVRQQSIPKPLKAALHEIKYSGVEITLFEKHYKHWRELKLGRTQVNFK